MSAALWAAVGAELVKVRRAVMLWATGIAFLVAALVGAFFMFVLQDPARARSLGLLGAKAQLSGGTADWAGYFALLAQMVAVGGMLLFGMVMIWLFGREFADRTAKDLLALPTSRAAVVVAKLVVALVWSAALTVEVIALSLPLGALLGLPGWSPRCCWHGVGVILATAVPDRGPGHHLRPRGQLGPRLPRRRRDPVRHRDHRADRLRGRLRRLVPVGRPLADVRGRRPRPGHPRAWRGSPASCWSARRPAPPPCCGGSAPTTTAEPDRERSTFRRGRQYLSAK